MSITLTNLTAEVQARCNALNVGSTISQVIDVAIAAKKVEMAGGTLTRTNLDTYIQSFVTASGGGSQIEDLIALAASLEQRASNGKTRKTKAFTTTGTWTKPLGVDSIEILLVGGGGGAGAATSTGAPEGLHMASGAGGGGQVLKQDLDISSITAGTSVSVVIGSGGSGGVVSGTAGAGSVGGDSTFGSLLTALGGGSGNGVNYSGGSVNGTVRATSGGQGSYMGHGTYGNVILPPLGGGAGGHATAGTYAQRDSNSGSGTSFTSQSFNVGATRIPCGVGLSFAGNYSGSSYYQYSTSTHAKAGPALYGYGAGGGHQGGYAPTPGIYGAGGHNAINALANSGGGGGSVESGTGGAGGSGYCLITWWE